MSKKIFTSPGIVYSTNPDFKLQRVEEEPVSLEPSEQELKIKLQKKHRAGKVVTLLEGYVGSSGNKENLCKKLKTFCGTGGSFKDGEIIIQGDQRDKVLTWLIQNGFSLSRKVM